MRKHLTIFLLLVAQSLFSQNIYINEIQSSNDETIYDFENNSPDWIELYNSSIQEISLKNYYLSDNISEPNKWIIPDISILPDSFVIIFASGKDTIVNNEYHTNFKISSNGEIILLSDSNLILIDKFYAVPINPDFSYGRITDGDNTKVYFENPTPNSSNLFNSNGDIYYDSIMFSHNAGFYQSDFFLTLSKTNEQAKIYYTIDGSVPTSKSKEYTNPINIYSKKPRP